MSAVGSGTDIVSSTVMYLEGKTELTDLLGVFTSDNAPWLFQTVLGVVYERTEQAAAVVSYAGGWGSPNSHNTMTFPRISVELYVDPQRDSNGNQTERAETERRALTIWSVVRGLLHRPAMRAEIWGTSVRVLSCLASGEVSTYPVPDGDGTLRAQGFFNLSVG
jgi:hypothetical protein